MECLYTPIDVPNFESIQIGLKNCLPVDYISKINPFAFNVDVQMLQQHCPHLVKWIESNSKVDVLHYRIYVTPPKSRLPPHIDGGGAKPIVPFRLNIPIMGTANTKLLYYSTTNDNLKTFVPDAYLSSIHPIDFKKLKLIDVVEINTPHFINTSILHGINNPNPTYRAMFAVTWLIHDTKYKEINDVFKINN